MKTAVCLSGQPRFLEECYESIYNNVILPNSADVFMHVWSYKDIDEPYKFGGSGGWKQQRISDNAHFKALDLYKPTRYIVEDKKNFFMPSVSLKRGLAFYSPGTEREALEAGMSHDDYVKFVLSNNISMWYSIYKSHMLAYEFSLSEGIEYDSAIRCRFDVKVPVTLNMSHFDQNYLYSCEMGKKYGHIADWLNFSNFENMSIYSSTFFSYKKIYSDIEKNNALPICNEMALVIQLGRHGIQCINIPMNLSLPRF